MGNTEYRTAEPCILGSGTLTISGISIKGTNESDFSIFNDHCTGAVLVLAASGCTTITPANACQFGLSFHPAAYAQRTMTIDLPYSSGGIPVNTFTWAGSGVGGIILTPVKGQSFPITQPGSNGILESTDPITFSATGVNSGQTVNWKTTVRYHTQGGVPTPAPTAVIPFPTTGTAQTQQQYTSEGGRLIVNATVGSFTDQIAAYITGPLGPSPDIPPIAITSQLTTLYQKVTVPINPCDPPNNPCDPVFSPATPGLMTQAVQLESSYRQFKTETLFTPTNFWPTESPQTIDPKTGYVTPQGAHIGLTQVPVSMKDAWDWLQNTQDGVDLFQSKLRTGYSLSVTIRNLHLAPPANTALPALTSCQLEEMERWRCMGLMLRNCKPIYTTPLIAAVGRGSHVRMVRGNGKSTPQAAGLFAPLAM